MAKRIKVKLGDQYATEETAGTASQPSAVQVPDWLECTHFSVGSNGEVGEARLRANKHPRDIDTEAVKNGTVVQLEDADDDTVVFNGVIVKNHTVINQTDAHWECVVYNTGDFLLRRIALHGQHRRTGDNEQTYFDDGAADGAQGETLSSFLMKIDTPLIFNPDGEPNCSPEAYFDNSGGEGGNTVYVFDAPFRNQYNIEGDHITSDFWTVKKAIAYLLNCYPVSWAIDKTSFSDIKMGIFDVYGDPVISNVNCEGKRLSEALTMILEPFNYGYHITQESASGLHSINFFLRAEGDAVSAVLPDPSDPDNSNGGTSPNVITLDINQDATAVVNAVDAYGSQKIFTTLAHTNPPSGTPPVMKLYAGWYDEDFNWALEDDGVTVNPYDLNFRKQYVNPYLVTPADGDDSAYYGAGRVWVVNMGEAPFYNLEDLTTDLGGEKNSVDPRKLEAPMLFTKNADGGRWQREDIQVEMSLDNGDHWAAVERKWYRVLEDRMGIVFVDPYLERLGLDIKSGAYPSGINYWQALYNTFDRDLPTLQIRVLCSVKSDSRVHASHPNDGAAFPLAIEGVFNNENGYRQFSYNPKISSTVYYTQNAPEQPTVDDTEALGDLCDQQADNTNRVLYTGRVVLLLESFTQVEPGQTVGEVTNFVTYDPPATVTRVVYNVADNHVELVLDNRKYPSVIRNRGRDGSTRQEHRLGIGNMQSAGGIQVPYVPGNSRSFTNALQQGQGNVFSE